MIKTAISNQNQLQLPRRLENPPWVLALLLLGLLAGTLLMVVVASFLRTPLLFCSRAVADHAQIPLSPLRPSQDPTITTLQMDAIVHYATSSVVPQQSRQEIGISLQVLKSLSPCNFLVFGLGHDSLMWAALNPRGTTLFLEEDPKWVETVLKDAPTLHAHTVPYRTQLSQADELLGHYHDQPECNPANNISLQSNTKCRLALNMLPDEVYEAEWDVIMIDAPRGYFPEAPGRMAAVYSAAVMAMHRKKMGVTHVMLHDVDRRVEKMYAEMFLCRKHLVSAAGRLWHFEIPPATTNSSSSYIAGFC